MRKCFGWLRIQGERLYNLPPTVRPWTVRLRNCADRQILPAQQYFAIVYEYIPEGDNDRGQLQVVLDFLWRAGFIFDQLLRKENWKSGVFVDLSDIISPVGYGWHPKGYRRTDASRAFLPPPPPPSPPPPPPPPASALHGSRSDSDTPSSESPSPSASTFSSSDTEEGE
jgi:hypothetical protein